MIAEELIRPSEIPQLVTFPSSRRARRAAVVVATIEIDRPPSDVWAAIADYSFDLKWRLGIVEMTPDPPGQPQNGTRIREVLRSSGRSFITNATVFDVEPGVSYRFSGRGTTGLVSGQRRVEASESGERSVFTYHVELHPTGFYRLLRPVLKGALGSGLRKDLQRLKAMLESAPVP